MLNNMSSLECYLRMKIGMDHNEKLMILFLDRKGYLQSEWCESGAQNFVKLDIRSMLYPIVIGKNITTAVIAHNHPSGVLTPSAEDIVATERICKVMAYLDIGLQDYLIITADDCISIMNDLY